MMLLLSSSSSSINRTVFVLEGDLFSSRSEIRITEFFFAVPNSSAGASLGLCTRIGFGSVLILSKSLIIDSTCAIALLRGEEVEMESASLFS